MNNIPNEEIRYQALLSFMEGQINSLRSIKETEFSWLERYTIIITAFLIFIFTKDSLFQAFATVHFYNQSKEKGIKATGIGIE